MKVLLFEKQADVERADSLGLNAQIYPEPDQLFTPSPADFIVISETDAKAGADKLVGCGLDAHRVEWLDACDIVGGMDAIIAMSGDDIEAAARDLYFGEIRTLRHAEDDEVTSERIPAGPSWAFRNIVFRRRELVVVAGPYGCGKSTLMQYLGFHWCRGPGAVYEAGSDKVGLYRKIPVWFCTWEDDAVEQRVQAERFAASHAATVPGHRHVSAEDLLDMVLYTRPEFNLDRDLTWYVMRARHMAQKYGTNYFVLDPWSEFDHVMDHGENETQYVKRIMKVLGKLSTELNAVFVVVTHITKSKYSDDMGVKPFRVADSMGSVQFGSTATRGLCVVRTSVLTGNDDHMVVYFDKVKIERNMGKAREIIALRLDADRHELFEDPGATMEVANMWGCNGGGSCEGKQPGDDDKDDNQPTGGTMDYKRYY